mmetsp:Transcript_40678/g.75632  ORF Transcript_40678/g.75632 Transcript_40678/m.75632 type:complete len:407 (+) Transcript_40678:147-1367(+)
MGGACGSARSVQVAPQPMSIVPTSSPEEPAQAAGSSSSSSRPAPVAAAPAPECDNLATVGTDPGSEQAAAEPEEVAKPPEPRKPKKTLIKAVKDNNLALIDELLQAGSSLEELGMWDNTPLLAACSYGQSEAALKLIAQKANVLAKNEHGATPMHYAVVEGLLNVVEALIANARGEGTSDYTSKLVNCGLARVYNRHLDAYAMRTPLISAAESGFAEIVSTLLACGADVEAPDPDGRTALWQSCRHSRIAVAKQLLQQGADSGVKDSKGTSVLEAATNGCSEELVLALLAHGVGDVNDTSGSPLRDAVKAGKRGIAEALLTHGAAVDCKSGLTGGTPLHAACENKDEYLVSLLVRARADPSVSDTAGLTAFDLLRRRGLPDGQIVPLLSPPQESTGGTGETAEALS